VIKSQVANGRPLRREQAVIQGEPQNCKTRQAVSRRGPTRHQPRSRIRQASHSGCRSPRRPFCFSSAGGTSCFPGRSIRRTRRWNLRFPPPRVSVSGSRWRGPGHLRITARLREKPSVEKPKAATRYCRKPGRMNSPEGTARGTIPSASCRTNYQGTSSTPELRHCSKMLMFSQSPAAVPFSLISHRK
jgi:hypothetical protein